MEAPDRSRPCTADRAALGQKTDDKQALPGCRYCHRELHELGPVEFAQKYSIDFEALIAKLNAFFESNLRGTY